MLVGAEPCRCLQLAAGAGAPRFDLEILFFLVKELQPPAFGASKGHGIILEPCLAAFPRAAHGAQPQAPSCRWRWKTFGNYLGLRELLLRLPPWLLGVVNQGEIQLLRPSRVWQPNVKDSPALFLPERGVWQRTWRRCHMRCLDVETEKGAREAAFAAGAKTRSVKAEGRQGGRERGRGAVGTQLGLSGLHHPAPSPAHPFPSVNGTKESRVCYFYLEYSVKCFYS